MIAGSIGRVITNLVCALDTGLVNRARKKLLQEEPLLLKTF